MKTDSADTIAYSYDKSVKRIRFVQEEGRSYEGCGIDRNVRVRNAGGEEEKKSRVHGRKELINCIPLSEEIKDITNSFFPIFKYRFTRYYYCAVSNAMYKYTHL